MACDILTLQGWSRVLSQFAEGIKSESAKYSSRE